jgi:hypothetical protein
MKESEAQPGVRITFKPGSPVVKEDQNFAMEFPLCKTHLDMNLRGKQMFRRMLISFACSLIPFVTGLILMYFLPGTPYSTILFICALVCCVVGYVFMEVAGKLGDGSGQKTVRIKWLTDTEIILDLQNEEWANAQNQVWYYKGKGYLK